MTKLLRFDGNFASLKFHSYITYFDGIVFVSYRLQYSVKFTENSLNILLLLHPPPGFHATSSNFIKLKYLCCRENHCSSFNESENDR